MSHRDHYIRSSSTQVHSEDNTRNAVAGQYPGKGSNPFLSAKKKQSPRRGGCFFLILGKGIRTGAGVNDMPGACQSRDPASAAAEVESLSLRHKRTKKSTPTFLGSFLISEVLFRQHLQNQYFFHARVVNSSRSGVFFALNYTSLPLFLYSVKSLEKSVEGGIPKNNPRSMIEEYQNAHSLEML